MFFAGQSITTKMLLLICDDASKMCVVVFKAGQLKNNSNALAFVTGRLIGL